MVVTLKSSWYSAQVGVVRVFSGVEGWILLAGMGLVLLTMLGFGAAWLFAPDATLGLAAMTGLNLLIGLAAGMSFGYAHGFSHLEVIVSSALSDTLQVLIFYPLFVLSWNRLIDLGRLGPYLARVHASAEKQKGWVRRFGIAGLFLFVFVPFWMTGPVVGSIIGFLIGLRARVNLGIVLSSSYLAICLWALLFNRLNSLAAAYNRWALFAAVIAVALLAVVARKIQPRRRQRATAANAQASDAQRPRAAFLEPELRAGHRSACRLTGRTDEPQTRVTCLPWASSLAEPPCPPP